MKVASCAAYVTCCVRLGWFLRHAAAYVHLRTSAGMVASYAAYVTLRTSGMVASYAAYVMTWTRVVRKTSLLRTLLTWLHHGLRSTSWIGCVAKSCCVRLGWLPSLRCVHALRTLRRQTRIVRCMHLGWCTSCAPYVLTWCVVRCVRLGWCTSCCVRPLNSTS
jgi:hypothetical protein